MAKTGSISITYTQNQSTNKSTITVKGIIKTTGDSYRGDHRTGTYTIKKGSTTIASGKFTSGADKNSTTTLFTATVTVTHNADGSYGTITASYTYDIGSGSSYWNLNASASKTIPTIQRQSTFGTITGDTINSPIKVNITRYSDAYTHSMWYSLGSKTWQVIGSNLGTSNEFTLPLSLCSEIPNSAEGKLTLILRTFNGSSQLGVDVTKEITIKVPNDVLPSFNSISHSDASSDVANAFGVYVQNKTKLNLGIVGASGNLGSTIKSYLIEVDNQKVNAVSGTTGFITSSGNLTIKGTVTDSRGRSVSKTTTVNVYEYTTPFFRNVDIIREDNAVVVTANGSVSSIMVNDVQKNELRYRICIKEKNSSVWTDTGVVSTGVIGYALQGRVEGLEANVSYEVKLYAADKITESGAYDLAVSTAIVFLDKDFRNRRIALGKMLEHEDSTVELIEDAVMYVGDNRMPLLDVQKKLSKTMLNEDDSLTVDTNLHINGALTLPNEKTLKGLRPDGTAQSLIGFSSANNIFIGDSGHSGNVNLYGNRVTNVANGTTRYLTIGSGDSWTVGRCILGAQVSSSAKTVYFSIPVGFIMSDISAVTISSLKFNIRIVGKGTVEGGYVGEGYVSSGYDYATNSNYSFSTGIYKGTNTVFIQMTQNVTYAVTNNTPVVVEILSGTLVFA